jgi:hypothetical protein
MRNDTIIRTPVWPTLLTLLVLTLLAADVLGDVATADPRAARPNAIVDLRTPLGVELVGGTWRFREPTIAEIDHRATGPDFKPSGEAIHTHDLTPRAGAAGFDDADWPAVAADQLEARRGTGRLSHVVPHQRDRAGAGCGV